jgi:hypothetical protein
MILQTSGEMLSRECEVMFIVVPASEPGPISAADNRFD